MLNDIRINFETDHWLDVWNNKYCELVALGYSDRNDRLADWCEEIILEAKKRYYGQGDTIMCDGDYDAIEGRLRILRPNSKCLTKVGG